MARHAFVLLAVSVAFSHVARAQDKAPQRATPVAPGTPAAGAGSEPAPGAGPPPEYYVEPPAPSGTTRGAAPRPAAAPSAPPPAPGVYEPPPPGYGYGPEGVYEPPPPPKPRHVAPKYSFWLGPRVGWFVPFGSVFYRCAPNSFGECNYNAVDWNDYASSGPMFEIDAGARLGRNYTLFLLWEHAALGAGDDESYEKAQGGLDSASTDYFGLGLRVSSDPNKIGFLTEINLGARRFRAKYANGTELQFTQDVPLELRLGLGADIRLSRLFSLSPLITLGIGRFDTIEIVQDGDTQDLMAGDDELASHGWLTFQIGGHFDVAGGG
jgi:hypothetical protein